MSRLRQHQLVVVTGKGGVGKTTVCAALGRLLAADRRTLLLEVDPRENLHHMLGVEPSGGDIVPAGPRLLLQNVRPAGVVEELVRERLKVRALARRVLASPVFQHFVHGAPGLKEMAVLLHALRLVRGETRDDVDVVVLDAPATGHGVSLLAAPGLVAEAIPHGPIGTLARDLSLFVADPARCSIVLVTAAEEMPVQETLELITLSRERLHAPEAVVVNGLYPPLPAGAPAAAGAWRLWADRRATNERELARLAAAWPGPTVELPLVPRERGPELIAALEGLLAA